MFYSWLVDESAAARVADAGSGGLLGHGDALPRCAPAIDAIGLLNKRSRERSSLVCPLHPVLAQPCLGTRAASYVLLLLIEGKVQARSRSPAAFRLHGQ